MITTTFYQCEICNSKYNSPESALLCESKGFADVSKYPIGLMYEYNHNGFIGIFAIAKVEPSHFDKHTVNLLSWAFRVPGYPASTIGEELCGGSNDYRKCDDESFLKWLDYHHITKSKVGCVEFKKMVDYLKSINIVPVYYDENKNKITL